MRSLPIKPVLTIAAAISLASLLAPPALARETNDHSGDQSSEDSGNENGEMIKKLADPQFQDGMVAMLSGMMGAMMKMPIGPVAAAIDQSLPDGVRHDNDLSRIDPDATLGDLAGADNPDFQRDMNDKMRKGAAMMGIMAEEFGGLLPQLQALGERMKARMGEVE